MGNAIRNTSSFGYPSGLTISARYLAHSNQKHGEPNAACICGRADMFCHDQDFPLIFHLSSHERRQCAHLATLSATAPGPWGPRLTADIRGRRGRRVALQYYDGAKRHTSMGSIIGEAHRDERRRGVFTIWDTLQVRVPNPQYRRVTSPKHQRISLGRKRARMRWNSIQDGGHSQHLESR